MVSCLVYGLSESYLMLGSEESCSLSLSPIFLLTQRHRENEIFEVRGLTLLDSPVGEINASHLSL